MGKNPGKNIVENDDARHRMFDEIIKNYYSMITRICISYSFNKTQLEDLRQDTLLNIWHGLKKFRGQSAVKTWVYRVTLNTCLSLVRKRKKQIDIADTMEMVELFDTDADRCMLLAEMYDSISRLPDLDKAVVMMWLDEYSYDEIALTMGLPRNTIATRLRRAKEKLKKTANML